jgi:Zn finger protein HypA/HybF involved in hydrogenase expression
MLTKTSDIVIDTKKTKVFQCSVCKQFVSEDNFDFVSQKCLKCKEDKKDNDRLQATNS